MSFGQRSDVEGRGHLGGLLGVELALDPRAPFPERVHHPLHRPPRQRRVADEPRREGLTREHAGQEAHRRPRVAAVDLALWRAEPSKTDAVDDDRAGLLVDLRHDAHRAKRPERREVVLAERPPSARDARTPRGDAGEQDRAMHDALVPRHGDAADERPRRRVHDEIRHAVDLPRIAADDTSPLRRKAPRPAS